jgi:hypothetical protein
MAIAGIVSAISITFYGGQKNKPIASLCYCGMGVRGASLSGRLAKPKTDPPLHRTFTRFLFRPTGKAHHGVIDSLFKYRLLSGAMVVPVARRRKMTVYSFRKGSQSRKKNDGGNIISIHRPQRQT